MQSAAAVERARRAPVSRAQSSVFHAGDCATEAAETIGKKSRLKMPDYHPPKRESIEEHLAVARKRVEMPHGAWDDVTESFVRSLVKGRLLAPMLTHPKAKGRGRGARMTPSAYRNLLRIVRLRALGVPRREWAFFLWLRGAPFSQSQVRAAIVASFRSTVRKLQRDVAPTGRYGLPTQVKAKRALDRDPDADPVMAPFLAAAFALMADPNSTVDIDSLWRGVPAALKHLGVDADLSKELMGLQSGETTPESALVHFGTLMRNVTGLDPQTPVVAQGLADLTSTLQSERMRSFILDKHDRSRLLERLMNAPWLAYERARALSCATTGRVFDRFDIETAPEEVRALMRIAAGSQGTLAKLMRSSPWVVVLHFAIAVEDGAPNTESPPTRFT